MISTFDPHVGPFELVVYAEQGKAKLSFLR